MAGVGATLFGLIFLVITIKPEVASTEKAAIMPQVQASSSYTALLNPLVISLFALVPHTTIGKVTLVMSVIGLVNTFVTGVILLQYAKSWAKKLRGAFFILASAIVYGYEAFYAIRLSVAPGEVLVLYDLTTLLVIIYIYGVVRAWDLVGVRQFHIRDMLTPLFPKRVKEIISNTPDDEKRS